MIKIYHMPTLMSTVFLTKIVHPFPGHQARHLFLAGAAALFAVGEGSKRIMRSLKAEDAAGLPLLGQAKSSTKPRENRQPATKKPVCLCGGDPEGLLFSHPFAGTACVLQRFDLSFPHRNGTLFTG